MKIHELKILPEYFNDVKKGRKNFELRINDRDYKVGDMLCLREWDGENYTNRVIYRQIEYVYNGCGLYGLSEGFCIIGMRRC